MIKAKYLFLFNFLIILIACSTEPKSNLKPLDLLSYGIPVTIMAPDSSDIKTMDFVGVKDVSIKKGDDFYIQIFSSDATTTNIQKIKMGQKRDVEGNPYFSKFVKEDDNGFIYETSIDSAQYNYGFCHIRVQGDKEYVFQTGLIGIFTLEEVEGMHDAVQPKKKEVSVFEKTRNQLNFLRKLFKNYCLKRKIEI